MLPRLPSDLLLLFISVLPSLHGCDAPCCFACAALTASAALRAELSSAESQLDAERKAHASTKAAATARERDLEEQLGSSRCAGSSSYCWPQHVSGPYASAASTGLAVAWSAKVLFSLP
jgi:hypothetical protein